MRKEGETTPKPGQAALIVTYGNTTHKYRPLDRDLFLLGRSAACDLALVSPEVAAVHCILQRTANGWRIRDCSGGRHATRLNGRAVHDEALSDNDVLQIGAFSFELRLPLARPTPLPGGTPVVEEHLARRIKRLQRSRRNLVRLALQLRRRVKKTCPTPPTLAELEKQAACLRGLQRDYQTLLQEYETRLGEVEQAEREVCDERAAFEAERAEQRVRMEQAERELARRQAELNRAPLAQVAPTVDDAQVTQQRSKNLDQRSRELHSLARYLQRCRRQLLERTPDASYPHEVEHWRQQCEQLQANWAVLEARFQQHDAELKAELTRLREEIRIARERPLRDDGGMRERLAQLRSLKEDLIGTAPSAPGSQLRPTVDLMGNPVQE